MAQRNTKAKKRTGMWIFLAVFTGFVAILIFGSLRTVQAECSLCVEFRGQRQCRTGAGATPKDAEAAAQRAACAVMAAGMDDSIACQNARPQQVSCTG